MLEIRATTVFILILVLAAVTAAQTTAFNYQGKLSDGGNPANGTYQMEFKLFDAPAGGNQIGATVSISNVTVTQGIFDAQLDFGAGAFPGADRFLEIAVRRNAGENYITLAPREQINTTPQAIRSRSAETADNADQLGGVAASEYVTNATVGSSFIRNGTTLQTGSFNISGNGFVGGNFGIGTSAPQSKLQVFGNGYGLTQTNGAVTVGTFLTAGSGWIGTRSNHPLNFFTNDGGATMQISTNGEIGIGVTPQAGSKLEVGGTGRFITPNGNINLGTPNGETGITFLNSNRADIRFDANGLKLLANTNTGIPLPTSGILITNSGNVGIGTVNPTTKFEVAGTTKTGVLQITGGSDLAENFEISEEAKPGMVVAIDPQNAGKLILARGAYNRQVAGIISGANDLSAGMILPNLSPNEKSMPLALSGRVWVYADATRNAIMPGDLLTTSDTAGYAMKVTKHKRANGAIIGKAMTKLEKGTGLVLVLVALQ